MAGRGRKNGGDLDIYYNTGQPWSEEEERLIMGSDLKDKVLSIKIGRTVSAIHNRRYAIYERSEGMM